MFRFYSESFKSGKILALFGVLAFISSCNSPVESNPSGGRYNSGTLAKDWRSNINDRATNRRYVPPYAYPADNDADYVYPTRGYTPPPPPRQPRYVPPQPNYPVAPYPQDNDANYYNSYPTYDPDADNSSYYNLNKNKRLPRGQQPNNSGSADDYNYPIYFD